MVSQESVDKQLKKIGFDYNMWGKAEVKELRNILLDHEEIYEAVNGVYDGGFAMLVATNVRLLLVDKKPLNYLTVEDMRFDMINEIDYSHRLFGARISISAGNKNLSFMSMNQQRLRNCIGHVQRCMAEAKKQQSDHAEDQKQHLAQINQQLQAYLLAQHQQQENLRLQLQAVQAGEKKPSEVQIEEVKPSPELSDYLLAQSLLSQVQQVVPDEPPDEQTAASGAAADTEPAKKLPEAQPAGELPARSSVPDEQPVASTLPAAPEPTPASPQLAELYAEGMREIFGKQKAAETIAGSKPHTHIANIFSVDLNPVQVCMAKLPLALRNRKFGRPSFHAYSLADQLKQMPLSGSR